MQRFANHLKPAFNKRKLQTVYEMFILNLIQATCWNRGRLHILFFYYTKCLKVCFNQFSPLILA